MQQQELDAIAVPPFVDLPRVVPLSEQCKELREKLREELLAGGLVLLSSGDQVQRNGDVFHAYRPHSDFYYVTGVSEPGWGCLLDVETGELTLLAPRMPEDAAIWSGPQPSLDSVAAAAGADRAAYTDDLPALLKANLGRRGGAPLLHTLASMAPALEAAGGGGGEGGGAAGGVRVTLDFLEGALARSRARKTEAEVACLLEANRVSASAHEAMWGACHPGVYEYQLEAAFVAACMGGGLRRLGYPCIVGAGRNAGVLHYERNGSRVGPEDLVLVDAGAEFRCYTADITRTFPASGAFGPRQRAAYDLTLRMQRAALAAIAPGAEWKRDVEGPARRLMLEGLRDMGLVKGDVEGMLASRVDRIFCPHGLGHHLGLDVHDVSECGPVPSTLDHGFVVTCEPGVYFMPLLLDRAASDPDQAQFVAFDEARKWEDLGGVRIEDNVAIMPKGVSRGGGGVLNLTAAAGAAPKDAKEVEAVMAARAAERRARG